MTRKAAKSPRSSAQTVVEAPGPERSRAAAEIVARIAVQMAREPAGRWNTLDEIAEDAAKVAAIGRRARASMKAGLSPSACVRAAEKALARYSASVICERKAQTIWVRFPSDLSPNGMFPIT